jgi:hypothetical protein
MENETAAKKKEGVRFLIISFRPELCGFFPEIALTGLMDVCYPVLTTYI